jgi:DNA-binding winged helix-turn-helix (wHTH) protein/tetratricopeptide (TPR) repeat protein
MHIRGRDLYAFEAFLFDPASGELKHNGVRVRMSKQTADVLTILVLNAGSLVTRQEIRDQLWPGGEIVDFDKIINNGISRLRYIFKDDPTAPTFIERVPKRGYRFIMPVRQIERPGARTLSEPPITDALATSPSDSIGIFALDHLSLVLKPTIARTPRQLRAIFWLSGTIVCLAALSSFVILQLTRSHTVSVANHPTEIALAVAPLDATGAGAAELAESFRLDLTDALAQLPEVHVRSAHSVNQLRLTDSSLPNYASKLGLDVILFGHFNLDKGICRLQFELVHAADATHIATLQYSGTVDQLNSIRDSIQRDIFTHLRLDGNGDSRPRGNTSDPDAYRSYLQARYQFSQQSPESLALSIKEYTAAIDRDPAFAKAYIGLAQTYLIMLSDDLISPSEGYAKANDAINKALRLDESSAEVHSILGFIRFYRDWNLAAGIDEERQAIHLEPHQPIYHQWLAVLLCDEGRYPEALAEVDLAKADDPYWPSIYVTEAFVSQNLRDSKRMINAARKLVELLPDSPLAYDVLANSLWYGGHPTEGIAEWRRMALLENDPERVQIEDRGLEAFRKDGAAGYARVRLEALAHGSEAQRHPNDFEPSEWYATAGENSLASAALVQMASTHNPQFLETVMDPMFAKARSEPDLKSFLIKTGLASQLAQNP